MKQLFASCPKQFYAISYGFISKITIALIARIDSRNYGYQKGIIKPLTA